MKKTLLILVAVAVVQMAGPASAVELIADGGDPLTALDVGEVTVTNDATNLIVTITIDTGDWEFLESHVHVAEAVGDIPQTKNGNAKPGKFDYDESDATTADPTEHVYTIPLADIGDGVVPGDDIVVAVHTSIGYVDDNGTPDDPLDDIEYEETAWGEGPEIADGRDWAMYIEYNIGLPDLIVAELSVLSYDEELNTIAYSFTIQNVGTAAADGDLVAVQAFVSADAIFNNGNDLAAGGTYLFPSPGLLYPGDTFSATFSSGIPDGDFTVAAYPYLVMMVDWAEAVVESDETNNTRATSIAAP